MFTAVPQPWLCPPEEDLQQIQVGADTKETVAEKIGVPASSGVLTNSGYYYVRMRTRTLGPLASKEIDRQVVAISFSEQGVVQNVERFGLEKGQVVQLTQRVTSSPVSDKSFIRQLLGNIGRFNPAGLAG
ncbi:outer membrane protein assembly factor BamE [Sulfitobacter porphyrae]|uniref:Outer membrane protein assembly factor BamE n=1 Tax=Sulfitobacter porphyrae TaxID=1246864 RepID=A0ABW2B3R8_9RHOB